MFISRDIYAIPESTESSVLARRVVSEVFHTLHDSNLCWALPIYTSIMHTQNSLKKTESFKGGGGVWVFIMDDIILI